MKHLLLTTIAAVLLVGCGKSQQSSPPAEAKPVEPVAETTQPEPPTAKVPDIPIHNAARTGNIQAVKQHLDAGTDVDAKDGFGLGRTPLHFAAREGHKKIVELLIDKGADMNAKADSIEFTPLHIAAREGHKEIVELLIAKGADVNARDEEGDTPLDWADRRNQTATTALLRKHGAKTGEQLKAAGK